MSESPVSVALPPSTDEAMQAGGFVLLEGGLEQLRGLLHFGRRVGRVIRRNYFWAFFFNTLFLPVAAAGLLTPLFAMLLMLASSSGVLLSSATLQAGPVTTDSGPRSPS